MDWRLGLSLPAHNHPRLGFGRARMFETGNQRDFSRSIPQKCASETSVAARMSMCVCVRVVPELHDLSISYPPSDNDVAVLHVNAQLFSGFPAPCLFHRCRLDGGCPPKNSARAAREPNTNHRNNPSISKINCRGLWDRHDLIVIPMNQTRNILYTIIWILKILGNTRNCW